MIDLTDETLLEDLDCFPYFGYEVMDSSNDDPEEITNYIYKFDDYGHLVGTDPSSGATTFAMVKYNETTKVYDRIEGKYIELSGEPHLTPYNDDMQNSGYYLDGGSLTLDVFKFMAKNTHVEWSFCEIPAMSGGSGAEMTSGYGRLTTRNQIESCATNMLTTGKNFYHSHPNYAGFKPSQADIRVAEEWYGIYEKFYIYYPHYGDFLHEYDKDSSWD